MITYLPMRSGTRLSRILAAWASGAVLVGACSDIAIGVSVRRRRAVPHRALHVKVTAQYGRVARGDVNRLADHRWQCFSSANASARKMIEAGARELHHPAA